MLLIQTPDTNSCSKCRRGSGSGSGKVTTITVVAVEVVNVVTTVARFAVVEVVVM